MRYFPIPRPLSIALIATLCFSFTVRAEDKPSPAVKRILDKAVGKVRANRTDFDKANKKPLDEARAELQELAKTLVDDGKADEATTVLAQVKTLDGDVMRIANAPAPVAGGGGRVPPQKPLLERMAGEWRRDGRESIVLRADGTANKKWPDTAAAPVKLTARSSEVAELTFPDGYAWQLRMAGDDVIAVLEFKDGQLSGQGLALTRIK